MRVPGKIVPISQHRQQFSIGGQQGPAADIGQQTLDLAMEIYARVISADIHEFGAQTGERDFARLAKQSQAAARAFFESMGVQYDGE